MAKYCLPIIKETKEEVLALISENPDYDYYEIWLSYIKDLDMDFIWKLSDQYNGKLVFLFRKQNLEKSEIEKEFREKIIKLLERSENYLDFDINDGSWGLDFVKAEKLNNKIIASFHNYETTPDETELNIVVKDMERYKPEIYKFSTLCKYPQDSLKLLTLLLKLKEDKKKFLVFGMGDEGRMVRIYGALWGNEFNFAPVSEDEKSAPGQMTIIDMEKIINLLDSGSSRSDRI